MQKFSLVVFLLLGSRLPAMAQGCSLLSYGCIPYTCSDYTPLPGATADPASLSQ